MNDTIMLACSMAACLSVTVIRKYYSDKTSGTMGSILAFNSVGSAVSALVLLALNGFGSASVFTVLLGCAFGVITALQTIANLKALDSGPMSYTSVIVSCSTVISAISGALFWNEQISLSHIIGIALMLASFFLAVNKKADEKGVSMRWLLLCLVTFLCTGGIGIMQKLHQSTPYKGELNAFLIIAFGVSVLMSVVFSFSKAGKMQLGWPVSGRWLLLGGMILSGICTALNNKWNLHLSGVMDSAVFFPIVNGGGLVLATLAAVVLFREKLTKKQWLGVALGIASVIFLCNPFGL